MKIIDLNLNYNEIRKRIEIDKAHYKAGKWAKLTGTSRNVISNIHGKAGKHNPSLQYIIAVARVIRKPIEWYLYGEAINASMIAEISAEYGTCVDSMDKWPEEIKDACRQLKDIYLSDHPVIKPALMLNLAAFQHSVSIEKSQGEEIGKLNQRLRILEEFNEAKQPTGTEGAASSSTGKPET